MVGQLNSRDKPVYNIRLAEEDDIDVALDMGKKFYDTTEISKLIPFSEDSAAVQFYQMLDMGFMLLVDGPEGVVGILGCHFYDFPYNRDYKGCMEALYWLEPEVRGGSVASRLLSEATAIAQVEGANYISMVALETSPEMIEKFYNMHGYQRSERTYIKGL